MSSQSLQPTLTFGIVVLVLAYFAVENVVRTTCAGLLSNPHAKDLVRALRVKALAVAILCVASAVIWNYVFRVANLRMYAYIIPILIPILLLIIGLREEDAAITARLTKNKDKIAKRSRERDLWKWVKWGLFLALAVLGYWFMVTRGSRLSFGEAMSEMSAGDKLITILIPTFLLICEFLVVLIVGGLQKEYWTVRQVVSSLRHLTELRTQMLKHLTFLENYRQKKQESREDAVDRVVLPMVTEVAQHIQKALRRQPNQKVEFDTVSLALQTARAEHLDWPLALKLLIQDYDMLATRKLMEVTEVRAFVESETHPISGLVTLNEDQLESQKPKIFQAALSLVSVQKLRDLEPSLFGALQAQGEQK